jgi:hypothetical protein
MAALCLEINVTAYCQQLFRDSSMPVVDRDVEERCSILLLKINVAARFFS